MPHSVVDPHFTHTVHYPSAAHPNVDGCNAGLARTVFMERRAAYGPTLDLQPDCPAPTAAQLAWLTGASGEFCIALRGGRAFGLRLAPAAMPALRPCEGFGAGVNDASAMVAGGTKVCAPVMCVCPCA